MKPALLLVRPDNRITDDEAVCRLAGWQAVPFSPQRLVRDEAAIAALPQQIRESDAVFWVSPSAVELGASSIPPDSSAVHVAVGRSTAAQLVRAGCADVHFPTDGKDSEAVAVLPLWQTLPQQAGVLIVRGHGGRAWLASWLMQRGFRVSYAEIYFRQPETLDWQQFAATKPTAVWVTSSELVRELFAQVPAALSETLKSLLYFTHHPRIAAALRQVGVRHIELINRLDETILTRYTEQTDERAKSDTNG